MDCGIYKPTEQTLVKYTFLSFFGSLGRMISRLLRMDLNADLKDSRGANTTSYLLPPEGNLEVMKLFFFLAAKSISM